MSDDLRSCRQVIRFTYHDAMHLTDARRREMEQQYPRHERKARLLGLPSAGRGAVYPIDDDLIAVPRRQFPDYWLEIGGLDFGWTHPTAAVRLVIDPDTLTIYVADTYRRSEATPMQHVEALLAWGKGLRWAWGLEGLQTRLSDDPASQAEIFRRHGLDMLPEHAAFDGGGVSVEQGVQQILEMMEKGQFKVFDDLNDWFDEKNSYHRDVGRDGGVARIVKRNDDLMDATRYAFMMRRYARPIRQRGEQFGGGYDDASWDYRGPSVY